MSECVSPQIKLQQLQQQCEPVCLPDAVCRYDNCLQHHTSISIRIEDPGTCVGQRGGVSGGGEGGREEGGGRGGEEGREGDEEGGEEGREEGGGGRGREGEG